MTVLLIETATDRGIVALVSDEKVLFYRELPFGNNNSKSLMTAIDEGLSTLKVPAGKLSYVAVGIGPGSFTGVRVAAASAQSISYAANIPLVGIPTLACFCSNNVGPFAVCIDAKIEGVYLSTVIRSTDLDFQISDPIAVPFEQVVEKIGKIETIVTPNMSVLKCRLEKICNKNWIWEELAPNPLIMAKISSGFHKNLITKKRLDLLYLRKPFEAG